jgi:D-alanyl-D-alanine carboxypeptidase
MRQLLAQHVDSASTRKTAPMIAEAPVRDTGAPQARTTTARTETATPNRFEMASSSSTSVREAPRGFAPAAGSDEPIRPVAVRTVSVKPAAPIKGARAAPAPTPTPAPTVVAAAAAAPPQPEPEAPATVRAETLPMAPAPARAGVLGYLPAPPRTASVSDAVHVPTPAPARTPEPVRESPQREAAVQPAAPATPAVPTSRPPQTRSGWVIQVGAYPAESEAKERLAMVKTKASRLLASASPFTETVQRGETTLYRARFAGLEREQAEAACKFLKRNDVDCLAMKN